MNYDGFDYGFVIVVKDYLAEICEFVTLSRINTPDGIVIYQIQTKYGEDFRKEGELSHTREKLKQECDELNEALKRFRGSNAGRKSQTH